MLSAPFSAPRAISGTVIEVRAVRPDGTAVLDGPARDPFAEECAGLHDLVLVLAAGEDRDQLACFLVRLVDVERLVRHQVAQRVGDAVEQRVEALRREDVVKHLRQTAVGLDERLGALPHHREFIGAQPPGLEAHLQPGNRTEASF
jgi:hypothetical protein